MAEHPRRKLFTYWYSTFVAVFPILEQSVPSPSDGWHACSRRCQLALDLPRKQATFTRPSHSLGDCFVVGIVLFLMKLLLRWNFHPTFVATFSPFVADRRATARTTATLSHAASRQKNVLFGWFWSASGSKEYSKVRVTPRYKGDTRREWLCQAAASCS